MNLTGLLDICPKMFWPERHFLGAHGVPNCLSLSFSAKSEAIVLKQLEELPCYLRFFNKEDFTTDNL